MSHNTFLRFLYPGHNTGELPDGFRDEYETKWCCPSCHTPRVGCGAVDVVLDRCSPMQWPLNYVYECSVSYAKREFLEQFGWERVTRDLHIGKVYLQSGKLAEKLVTFRGKNLLIVRGVRLASYRICETCMRLRYFAVDDDYLYPAPPADADIFECSRGALVVRESVAAPVAAKRWPHVKVDRLRVVDEPLDGFPAFPTDN